MTAKSYFEYVAGHPEKPSYDTVEGDPSEEAPILRITLGSPEQFCQEHAEPLPCGLCVLFAAMEDRS